MLYTSLERVADMFVFWYDSPCWTVVLYGCFQLFPHTGHSVQASPVLGAEDRHGVLLSMRKWNRVHIREVFDAFLNSASGID